jgi:hypothetical protein
MRKEKVIRVYDIQICEAIILRFMYIENRVKVRCRGNVSPERNEINLIKFCICLYKTQSEK